MHLKKNLKNVLEQTSPKMDKNKNHTDKKGPRKTSQYTAEGLVGLLPDKKVALLNARGGLCSGEEMAVTFVKKHLQVFVIHNITTASAWMFAISPVGMMICGLLDLEQTKMHAVGFLLSTETTVIGFLVAGLYFRDLPEWNKFGKAMLIGSPITLVLMIFFFITFDPTGAGEGDGIGGIDSRLLASEVLIWFFLIGWISAKR
jgi:hypothetical protein